MKHTISSKAWHRVGLSILFGATVLLSACGGGGGGAGAPQSPSAAAPNTGKLPPGNPPVGDGRPIALPPGTEPPVNSGPQPVGVPVAATRAEAARFLTQASFGANEASIDELMKPEAQGGFGGSYAKWIDAQLAKPISAPTFYAHAQNSGGSQFNLFWRHAVYGEDQLRQRMAFALSQIFVTSAERDFFPEAWRNRASASYYGMLTRNAFGNYRTVLEDVSMHPYMGIYLGTLRNRKESEDGLIIPDQNYAREVMQLFSLGLYQLHPDGSIMRTQHGAALTTYNNEDIAGLSRVFTGWSWDNGNSFENNDCGQTQDCNDKPMKGFNEFHSVLEKKFIGKTIAAGTNITDSMKQALDHIGSHPNVAPFISRRLIQQFVTSNPTRDYIGRVSAVFTSSGGNLGQVIKAILLDPEARDINYANTSPGFGKLREPVIRLTNWMRAFDLTKPNGDPLEPIPASFAFASKRSELCQYPMSSPSVFNFWRPGYVPNKAFAAQGFVAPEMQAVHEVCVANYLQMMKAVVDGVKDSGSTNAVLIFGLTSGQTGDVVIKSSYARELNLGDAALVARMNELLAAGRMSPALQNKVKAAVESVPANSDANKLRRAKIAAFLTMASNDYLIQK